MATTDTAAIEWYVNEYDGQIPPAHKRLKGLYGDNLAQAVAGMDEHEADILGVTAVNVRNAVNAVEAGTASSKPSASSRRCECLDRLLADPGALNGGGYSARVEELVKSMVKEASTGQGCGKCMRTKMIRKYRPLLLEALKADKRC